MRARRAVRWAVQHARLTAGRVRRAWRRSLQLRVVATTMALGLVAVTMLAAVLAGQISDRLFESRRDQAELEAGRALADFRDSLATAQVDTPARVQQFLNDSVPLLAQPGIPSDRRVLLLRSPNNDGDVVLLELAGLPKEIVPPELRAALRSSTGQFSQPVAIPEGDQNVPGLVVGQQVAIPLAGPYELYFVFSLQREQETLEAVQRVLVAGGAALVVLVGGVAFVVTRQVVAPVRQAAAVAGRLSSGRLDERMEALSRVQRRFVSDVSHELRTPLTTIRMAGEVLHESRHTMDPTLRRSTELLSTQLDRFEELLADLLEISRFDAGAAALEAEPADVRGVVDRVVELAQPLAERRGSDLRTVMPDTPCMAEIDARRVERIVRNLVVNAIEHGEGRPIEVRLAADADAVAVVVRDRGVGLRPQDAERVFDRFWRADPARARTSGGTGLGLAIALEDAHLHAGTLEAWGQPGQGASFRLTLPRRAGVTVHRSPLPLLPADRVGRAPVPHDPPAAPAALAAPVTDGPSGPGGSGGLVRGGDGSDGGGAGTAAGGGAGPSVER